METTAAMAEQTGGQMQGSNDMSDLRVRFIAATLIAAFVLSACGSPDQSDSSIEPQAVAGQSENRPGLASVQNCKDTPHTSRHSDGETKAVGYIHEISRSSLSQARRFVTEVWAPAQPPEWVQCATVDLVWGTKLEDPESGADGWSITARGFDAASSTVATRALIFRDLVPVPPGSPTPPGEWTPIEGRDGWYQDVSASRTETGEEGPGTRIAWIQDDHFFELMGPFDLATALRVADSVQRID